MKITFLVPSRGIVGDRDRSVVAHANALAARHAVELLSVGPKVGKQRQVVPAVKVRHLRVRKLSGGGAAKETRLSTWVPRRWDASWSALDDELLAEALPKLANRVVITTTDGLLAAVTGRLPSSARHFHFDLSPVEDAPDALEAILTCVPGAEGVIVPTAAKAAQLRTHTPLDSVPVHVVPTPAPEPGQPRSVLDQPTIMVPGPLVGSAQVELLETFAAIAPQHRDWRIRVLGEGRRGNLEPAIRRHGLYDRVEVIGNAPDHAAEWARAGFAVLPQAKQPAPIFIQHAFAAGVPVVAYDSATGPSELVQDGVNGMLLRRGDRAGLRNAIAQLIDDAALRRKLGEGAAATAAKLTPGNTAERWAAALKRRESGTPPVPAPTPGTAPAITPQEARERLIGATIAALAGIAGWFVLPARGEFPPTFVVPAEAQTAVLEACAAAAYPNWCSATTGERDHWQRWRGPVVQAASVLQEFRLAGLTLEPWPTTAGEAVSHLAHGAEIVIEFWSRDREGGLNAPRSNPYLDRVVAADVDTTLEVEGHEVPGIGALDGRFVEQCDFPVDVVYTWVDDSDPAWRERRAQAEAAATGQLLRKEASGDARFRNRDELRYSLRSLHAHAPWIRRIFLVTAGQRPGWLVDHPRVAVVDHADILPAEALPTFNSHAIESALHKVPGLGEHYIYFNDDVFLARPVGAERFFAPSGAYAAFFSQRTLGVEGHDDRPFVRAGLNNRRLLRERFGLVNTHTVAHTPHPMRRSVLEQMCAEFAEAVDTTARAPFRAPTDVSVTASLAQHYGVATGAAFLSTLDLAFVDTSRANVRHRLQGLLAREHEAFCLGDHHHNALREEELNKVLHEFFEAYFPVRPPWEAPDNA